jgi:cytochrome c oxidase assembly protein subunit 15
MRHTGAGLAIPDFPWAFGRLVPQVWSGPIAVHYAHRLGALCVASLALALIGHVWHHYRSRPELLRPSLLLALLVVLQISLGALTVLTGKHYVINSLHVVAGALVLGTSLVLTLRAFRPRLAGSSRSATSQSPTTPHQTYVPVPDVFRRGSVKRNHQREVGA